MTALVTNSSPSLLGVAGAAGQGTSLFDSGTDQAPGDLFSQLLGSFDSGQGQNTGNPPQPAKDVALLAKPGELVAQETATLTGTLALPKITQLLERPITPQDATKLIATLDASSEAGDGGSQLRQQLKEQLTQISQGTEPKTVAQIIQALPAVKEVPSAPTAQVTRGGTVQRVLQLLHSAIVKTRDIAGAPTEDETTQETAIANALNPNLQSLQAANFRPIAEPASPASTTPEEQKTDELTRVEITPLAQQIIIPQWVNAIGVSPIPVRADLDAAIPPLNAGLKKEVASLPEVDLPKADLVHEAAGKHDNFLRHLGEETEKLAVIGEAKQIADPSLKQEVGAGDHGDASTNPVLNPSSTNGHSATQTAQAVQPAAVTLPAHVINHAPVAEQVHVAVARATKDGIDQITIQLSPEHLGRVEVKFHTNSDGQTLISFLADKPETFDALSRDARSLESALQESGIKADAGSMQFNLRQQPQHQANNSFSDGQGQGPHAQLADETDAAIAAVTASAVPVQHYRINIHDGVDIHA